MTFGFTETFYTHILFPVDILCIISPFPGTEFLVDEGINPMDVQISSTLTTAISSLSFSPTVKASAFPSTLTRPPLSSNLSQLSKSSLQAKRSQLSGCRQSDSFFSHHSSKTRRHSEMFSGPTDTYSWFSCFRMNWLDMVPLLLYFLPAS